MKNSARLAGHGHLDGPKLKQLANTARQVADLLERKSHFHVHRYLIENQEENGYTLTPEQIDKLVDSMCTAKSEFHNHQYLIEHQKANGYTLTPEQIDKLVDSMCTSTSHFHVHQYLIENQEAYGYTLTPEQINRLSKKAQEKNDL